MLEIHNEIGKVSQNSKLWMFQRVMFEWFIISFRGESDNESTTLLTLQAPAKYHYNII